jgi:hypothetical protein
VGREESHHCPSRVSNPGRPARSLVTTLIEVSRALIDVLIVFKSEVESTLILNYAIKRT